jgi:transglutaminase-like putative cysteine protease
MKYRVTHKTAYEARDSVSVGHNQAWLELRPVDRQQVESFLLSITPEPSTRSRRIDAFGNPVQVFSFNEGYQQLSVTATTVVTVRPTDPPQLQPSFRWEDVLNQLRNPTNEEDRDALEFAFPSQRVTCSSALRDYAASSFTPGRNFIEALEELTRRIHKEFVYDNRATTVNTPVADVFRLKRGVCQDFAHVQISMLRSLGIPARYISGYLRTISREGQPRLVGADASHAWLSVYCGNGRWIDVDPTNDAFCSTDHIILAWGRDYGDVPPLTGVFVGGGHHRLFVSVDVMPLP